MKKLLTGFLLLLVIAIVIFYSRTSRSDQSNTTPTPDQNISQEVTESAPSDSSPTHYLNYSPDILSEDKNTKFVLFFYANWCPTCKPIHKELVLRDMEIPNDLIVMKVNYNDNETDAIEKELAYKYGATYQHTFVQIDSAGKEIKKWQGGGLDDIISNLQ